VTSPVDLKKWKIARSFPRFGIDVPITVTGSGLPGPRNGHLVDIGLGGLCAKLVEEPLRTGERFWVEFMLPRTAQPMKVLAKVKYTAGQRHGFQFLSITPAQRELIRSVCEKLTIV
jgi:PilZ domain-containing protein